MDRRRRLRRIAVNSPHLLVARRTTTRRRVPSVRRKALPDRLRGFQLRVVGIARIGFGLGGIVEGLPVLGAGSCGHAGCGGRGDLAAVCGGDVLRTLLVLGLGIGMGMGMVCLGSVLLGVDGCVLRVGHALTVVVDVFGGDVTDAARAS